MDINLYPHFINLKLNSCYYEICINSIIGAHKKTINICSLNSSLNFVLLKIIN